jgi:hypothetical protein
MASENIGSLYPTKMPGYEDAADIQAALRLYHYGSETYDPANTNPSQIPGSSIAGHLKSIEDDVAALDSRGIGSVFQNDEPSSPIDGLIWVDSNADLATDYFIPSVEYQIDAPTTNLTNGMLWVQKGSSPLAMYVYDAEDEEWKEIGA